MKMIQGAILTHANVPKFLIHYPESVALALATAHSFSGLGTVLHFHQNLYTELSESTFTTAFPHHVFPAVAPLQK